MVNDNDYLKPQKCCLIGEHKCDMLLESPEHMKDIKEARIRKGLSPKISIDGCLYPSISTLWSQGYKTIASCCGHGDLKPTIVIQLDEL